MRAAPAALHRAHDALARHLLRTSFGAAAVLGLLLLATRWLSVDADMAALLPGGDGSPREAARLLSEFGALDTLLLDLQLPGATPDALVDAGERLQARLAASGRFAAVYAGPSTAALFRTGELVHQKRLLLLQDPAGAVRARLEPEALQKSLEELKRRLASAEGIPMKGQLLSDPLGLDALVLSQLASLGGGAELFRGHLLSRDRAHLLLVATPKKSALDVDASADLLDFLRAQPALVGGGPGGPAVLEAVGGPRFAAESAALARRDVFFNFFTSGAALLALFLLRFRSLKTFALVAVPLGFGVAVALGAVALFRGRIHGLTLGFGSALIGIAVDYPMYLLNRANAEAGEPAPRFHAALDDVWSSLWLGWGTTALGFAVLLLSSFPAVRELGLFAGAGITGAFACTLVLLPPLATRLGPRAAAPAAWAPRLSSWELPAGAALALCAVVLAACAFSARALRYDGDLRHLDTQRPETLEAYRAVLGRFGQASAEALAVSRGADLEAALAVNDGVEVALSGARAKGWVDEVKSISPFLPSRATQQARARALGELDLTSARAVLARAAEAQGFRAGAFDSFWDEVRAAVDGKLTPLTREELQGSAVEPLVDRAIHCEPSGCGVVTALRRTAPNADELGASLPPGSRLVDADALATRTMVQIPRQMFFLCAVGLFTNLLLLAFAYRSLRAAAMACLPCTLGLFLTVGVFAAARVPLDLVSGSALVLILGCGVDYGIFMVHGLLERRDAHGVDALGVALTSATTLLGFGTMVFASHRALQSIGLAVSLGIAASALATLFLMPRLAAALLAKERG